MSLQNLFFVLTDTMTWSHPETFGTAPLARHGHAVVIADGVLYVHGGLAGQALFDDLHALDLGRDSL